MRTSKFWTWLTLASMFFGTTSEAQQTSVKPPSSPRRVATRSASIADLDKDIQNYQNLLSDEDVGSDPDIRQAVYGKWVEATCQKKRLRVRQILPGAAASLGDSVYQSCTTRLMAQASAGPVRALSGGVPTQGALAGGSLPALPQGCSAIPNLIRDFDVTKPLDRGPRPMGQPPSSRTGQVRLNANSSGAEIYTKALVYVAYINRLRYTASLGGVVTPIAAPTIPSAVFPSAPTQTAAPQSAPKVAARLAVGRVAPPTQADLDRFNDFKTCLDGIRDQVDPFQLKFEGQKLILNQTRDKIRRRLDGLQPIVNTAQEARAAADLSIFPPNEVPAFPMDDVVALRGLLAEFISAYAQFEKWAHDYGQEGVFDANKTIAEALAKKLGDYFAATTGGAAATPTTSQQVTDYEANRDYMYYWLNQFRTVAGANDDYFIVDFQPACGGWFGQGTSTQMQLTVVDNLNPTPRPSPTNLDKVVCQPTLSVSNGLAMSFIPDRVPAFVAAVKKDAAGNPVLDASGNPVIIQTLGYSSEAKVRPGYALQVNASLWRSSQADIELHWTAGAMLTAATGGVTTDIITGPAISFRKRTFFVSPVYDLGLRTQYLGGFTVGMPQGNLTSPPTHQVWKSGFGLTITFPFNVGTTTAQSSNSGTPGAAGGATPGTPPPAGGKPDATKPPDQTKPPNQ